MKEYKLCYVEGNKAWFSDNFEKQWGDDWNDRPYECNAEEPYDNWIEVIREEGEEEGKNKIHKIQHKTLYFETEDWMDQRPCDIGRFSVEDINKQAVAWVHTSEFNILAGTTIEKFIETIESNGGKIYLERGEEK